VRLPILRNIVQGGGAVLSGLLLLLVFNVNIADAANSDQSPAKEEITLSPAVVKISANPGQLKSGKFTVLNTGEKKFSFIVYARPYSVNGTNYSPNYQDTSERSNLYRWVQFDATEGELKPGEEKVINYTILIPPNAEAGGHYGVLFAETVSDADEDQVIARNKRVGSIIRLSVGGDIERSGKVESQDIPWLQTRPPMTTKASISNDGNIDFDAVSTLRVTTLLGREVYNARAEHVIYPDKPRSLSINWEGSSVLGWYHVEQTIDALGDKSTVSGYVLMVPRWALIVFIMAIVSGGAYAAYRRLR
jgi:hypothetical protein